METPPRAWGRPSKESRRRALDRNTPTGVGKTLLSSLVLKVQKKHPHGRGEDVVGSLVRDGTKETPPRAWGRPGVSITRRWNRRNTPTGVGKTPCPKWFVRSPEKHPHGRGEDNSTYGRGLLAIETPPRAWGRRTAVTVNVNNSRNTPTGVGKTLDKPISRGWLWKHPHGRGEDRRQFTITGTTGETPPRAWGRRSIFLRYSVSPRNTPTGVGKTNCRCTKGNSRQKHPHGRGEDG